MSQAIESALLLVGKIIVFFNILAIQKTISRIFYRNIRYHVVFSTARKSGHKVHWKQIGLDILAGIAITEVTVFTTIYYLVLEKGVQFLDMGQRKNVKTFAGS